MIDGLRAGRLVGVVDETLPVPRVIRPADTESRLGWRRGPNGLVPLPPEPGNPCPTCGHIEPLVQPAGGLRLDERRRQILSGAGELPLTPIEYRLLAELLRQPGRLLARRELARRVWGEEMLLAGNIDNLIRTHLGRVRGKLQAAGVSPGVVATVTGLGLRVLEAGEMPRPVKVFAGPRLWQRSGDGLQMNRPAYELLGRPTRVGLAYDAARKQLSVHASASCGGHEVIRRMRRYRVRCSQAALSAYGIRSGWSSVAALVGSALVAVMER